MHDYRINAQVRALFVRLNVDLTKVEHGTTNGVIYVRGAVRNFNLDPSEERADARIAEAAFIHRLEKALRRVPGVRDVVFQLDSMVKVGSRWKAK